MEKNIAAEMHLATIKTQAAIIASLTARLSVIATMAENGEHGIAALAREAAGVPAETPTDGEIYAAVSQQHAPADMQAFGQAAIDALVPEPAAAQDLSDEAIIQLLASLGTDAEKSIYDDNPVLQVRTTVPGVRNIIKAYLATPPQPLSASAAPDGHQGTLSVARIVRNAIMGNSHPTNEGYLLFLTESEVDTVGDQVARAIAAAPQPLAEVSAAQAVPIYQHQSKVDRIGLTHWVDCTRAIYESCPEAQRRIVFASPAAQAVPIAYAIYGINGSGKHYLHDVKKLHDDWKIDDGELGGYWSGNEPLASPSLAAQAVPEGFALVPVKPTAEMIQRGGRMNSEWLNDNAPLGECRYQMPIQSIWDAMLQVAAKPIKDAS